MTDDPERDDGSAGLAAGELDQLIADYTDGQLDSTQARRLLELMESAPEIRARLAEGVVVERLLRALGRGATPSSRIMDAVHAERNRTRQLRRPPAPRSTGRGRSLGWAVALLAVLAAFIAVHFRARPSAPMPVAVPAVPIVPPVPAVPPIAPPALPVVEVTPPVASAPVLSPVPAVLRPVFPLELPPPPPDVTAPPAGDGSGEPGFVAVPAEWKPAKSSTPGEGAKPEPPLLWVSIQPEGGAVAAGGFPSLVDAVQRRLGVRYGWSARTWEQVDGDPTRNPVLFFSTNHRFSFTPAQRALVRKYLLSGGMLVFNAAAGSAPAYDAARRELRLILPELPIRRLGDDHPLLHAYYDLDHLAPEADRGQDRPWLEGVTIACRTAAVISRWDLAAGWAGWRADTAYAPEGALQLGINLSSYATAVRAWSRQASSGVAYPEEAASGSDRLFVAQVEHDGEWRTRYAALPILLHAFNQRTEVPVKLGIRTMRLTDPRLFNAPLLYLTGHEPLALGADEVQALKRYLENGGFLFAEACCGRRSFDRSFRALMQQVLPAAALEAIPDDAVLFRTPNAVASLGVTPSLAAKAKSMVMRPRLEGMRVGASYGVVYSPLGLAGAWEASPMPYADGYDDPAALKLGQNILFQAITQ